jgi:hypothetical protein
MSNIVQNEVTPGSLLNPANVEQLCGFVHIAHVHFQIRSNSTGVHLIEFPRHADPIRIKYIKRFEPGWTKEAEDLLKKLERLYPCCFLAKEYPIT